MRETLSCPVLGMAPPSEVHDLKHFIELTQRKPRALAGAIQGLVGGYDSPFEEALAQGLPRKVRKLFDKLAFSVFGLTLGSFIGSWKELTAMFNNRWRPPFYICNTDIHLMRRGAGL